LIDKVIPRKEVWDCRELWAIPRCIIVEFEQRNGKEFHVFGNSKNFALWHLHKEKLLAFFRFGNVSRYKWIHERFKVGPPPLGKTVTDFPVVVNPVGGIELA